MSYAIFLGDDWIGEISGSRSLAAAIRLDARDSAQRAADASGRAAHVKRRWKGGWRTLETLEPSA